MRENSSKGMHPRPCYPFFVVKKNEAEKIRHPLPFLSGNSSSAVGGVLTPVRELVCAVRGCSAPADVQHAA